ncbi:hypothetical protein DES53_101752 [Roseimicrobium gellanilyticum]|uniref:Outer membrane protein n=2 Tax=Roseimicrobium gellanilyticum TaxID=748857 RepID=A0A366HUJ9_9BACT|nr:hypothetical protein DES53_101752 [Roseimicrobium gellanilyticum]
MKFISRMNPGKLAAAGLALAIAALMTPATATAGTVSGKGVAPVTPPVEEKPFITGNLSLFYDTHFISYGQDVWGVGNDWGEWFFHPSMELDFQITDSLQFYVNVWADVNDQIEGDIGDYVQEIDVNVGFYYTLDKFKFQLGYGSWNYASQTEHIIDGKVTYMDGLINPFVAVHGRVGIDIPGYDEGVVAQVGVAPSTALGPVTLSFPITVSFDTDGFHAGDGGFAYVSAGVGASIPIHKQISLSVGATYYHTQDDVIPNADEDFVVGSAGIVFTF